AVATAAVAGVLVFQGVSGTDGTGGTGGGVDAKSAPARVDVHANELKVSADGTTADFTQKHTKPFSLLGVTWTDPAAKVSGTVEARTRSVATGEWTGWLPLATDVDGRTETGQPGVRGTTEPRWVGASNGVEVRVTSGGTSSAGLPAGLRLDTVDPGTSGLDAETAAYAQDMKEGFAEDGESAEPTPADTTSASETPETPGPTATGETSDSGALSGSDTGEPTATPTTAAPTTPAPTATPTTPAPSATTASPSPTLTPAPVSTMPKPPIVGRAGWGADEKLNNEAPEYTASVKAVFVHHTAQTNNYSCADSPAIMRSLHAFHVQSNGWKDLGYNFIVDKCGTIFEGRKGGVDQPVLGAHTYGFNRETAGIAVIGMYTDTKASTPATTAVARLAAWKLGQYKGDPAGRTTLVAGATQDSGTGISYTAGKSYTFNQISGHRDGFNTECPGTALYGQLGAIRSASAGPVTGLAISSVTGSSTSGTTTYTQSGVKVSWTATTPSALISKYELLVDGKSVATTSGTATSASATLALGTHKVQVRATHMSGKVAPLSAAATVVAEKTAPVFTTKPSLALSAGTVSTTAVPVTLKWKAADGIALKEVRLTAPVAKTYTATTSSAAQTTKPGVSTTWKMSAYDRAGNTAAASVTGTPVILQETSTTRTGTWTAKSSTSYLGGKSYSSSAKNASMTWTFTGRSAALVVSRASTSGQVYVYVDGKKTATVDLKATTTKYRDAIWTTTWPAAAKHTVKLVVVGTSGRPAVTTDGLVYLK
ncbi:N-acetylmuramoyl-L-alanine amidase, partial [Streptomyces sp. NPDC060198]|uniref:N-acetylmuramoyl-L-alanine amidase n=1 Tax=Streptomyces sp. NPDC060198 TaxID=3347070 RepID=UPI003661D4DD